MAVPPLDASQPAEPSGGAGAQASAHDLLEQALQSLNAAIATVKSDPQAALDDLHAARLLVMAAKVAVP